MKKKLLLSISILLIAAFAMSLTACYVSKPGTMSDFVGTYELVTYTRTPKSNDSENPSEAIDMIKERGIVAYFIAKDDGTGYYVYKDNTTPAFARAIKINYTYESEDSNLLKEIRYDDGIPESMKKVEKNGKITSDGYPGKCSEILGVYLGKKDKHLSYTMASVFGREYSQTVRYKKVSGSTDLGYAAEKVGATLAACPFEMNGLGTMSMSQYEVESDPYIYYILSFSATASKANVYYALKTDKVPVVEEDVAVTIGKAKDEYDNELITYKVGGQTYYRYNWSNSYAPNIFKKIPASGDQPASEQYWSHDSRTVEACIETILSDYDLWQQQQAEQAEQAEAEADPTAA